VGLLLSGGIDSCVLLQVLLEQGHQVQPFFIQSGLIWERQELLAVVRLMRELRSPSLDKLVSLQLSVADIYGDHWSITGGNVPDANSSDDAVFLPGRNVLLVVKAALWCQMHEVNVLALATLGSSPFRDATAHFFRDIESVFARSGDRRIRIIQPFAGLDKAGVVQLGSNAPLELTFSCLNPVEGLHCGVCNKCAERAAVFEVAGLDDKTRYANAKRAATSQ